MQKPRAEWLSLSIMQKDTTAEAHDYMGPSVSFENTQKCCPKAGLKDVQF
jgi:hypothetical protein